MIKRILEVPHSQHSGWKMGQISCSICNHNFHRNIEVLRYFRYQEVSRGIKKYQEESRGITGFKSACPRQSKNQSSRNTTMHKLFGKHLRTFNEMSFLVQIDNCTNRILGHLNCINFTILNVHIFDKLLANNLCHCTQTNILFTKSLSWLDEFNYHFFFVQTV